MSSMYQFLLTQVGKPLFNSPSPFMRWLLPVLKSIDEQTISFQYTIRDEMTNPAGKLHGGVIAGIIDDATGAMLFILHSGSNYVTMSNTVHYYEEAKAGEVVYAVPQIIRKGNTIVYMECCIYKKETDLLLAKGSSTVFIQSKK